MQINELLATLHNEVQKSYRFINETKSEMKTEASVLHLAIERVEIDLPVTFSEENVNFDPNSVKGIPKPFKKLQVPFLPNAAGPHGFVPKRSIQGKSITAETVGHVEKIDGRLSTESIGRIRVVFKSIIT